MTASRDWSRTSYMIWWLRKNPMKMDARSGNNARRRNHPRRRRPKRVPSGLSLHRRLSFPAASSPGMFTSTESPGNSCSDHKQESRPARGRLRFWVLHVARPAHRKVAFEDHPPPYVTYESMVQITRGSEGGTLRLVLKCPYFNYLEMPTHDRSRNPQGPTPSGCGAGWDPSEHAPRYSEVDSQAHRAERKKRTQGGNQTPADLGQMPQGEWVRSWTRNSRKWLGGDPAHYPSRSSSIGRSNTSPRRNGSPSSGHGSPGIEAARPSGRF